VVSANGAGVNLRSGPSRSSRSIGFYDVGTKAGMIELGTTWSKINVDGKVGYMMTMYLSKTEPSPYYPLHGTYVWSSNGKNVNLRSEPRITSTTIDSIAPGTPVTILTPGKTWHFVKIGTEYGYMMAQFIITK
jgi:mannosyl-glycoprotein endo-beta-N-acetylglucosaminidase